MLQLIISPSSSDFFNVCRWFTIIAVHFPGLNFAVYYNFPTLEVNSPLKLPTLFQLILGEKSTFTAYKVSQFFYGGNLRIVKIDLWPFRTGISHFTLHSSPFTLLPMTADKNQSQRYRKNRELEKLKQMADINPSSSALSWWPRGSQAFEQIDCKQFGQRKCKAWAA